MDPIFWLGISLLLVAVSIAAVLLAAIPAMQELGRAAKGAERLFDTLNRELPPTLEAIRLTSLEFTELTDDLTGGAQSASNIVQQVDGSVSGVKEQAQQVKVTTKSVMAGVKAAWKTLTAEEPATSSQTDPTPTSHHAPTHHLPTSQPPTRPPAHPIKPEVVQSRLAGYESNGHSSGELSDPEKLIAPIKKSIDPPIPSEDQPR